MLMLCLVATASPVQAKDAILTFPQAFFAGAQLATAYDMVGRLPGFVYVSGSNARGYSGTAGNVVIDGARPSAKTDDLSTILQRIPVSRVDHIDVIRGGAPGIDMQGQSVVANVVLKKEDSTSVVLTLQNLLYGNGHDVPYGNVEFTRHSGGDVYDITLSRYGDNYDDSIGDGTRTLKTPGQPEIVTGEKHAGADKLGWGGNASVLLPLWGGSFGANLTLKNTIFNTSTLYSAPAPGFYFDSEKTRPMELGSHWDGNAGSIELGLLALQRLDHQKSLNTSDDAGGHQVFTAVRNTGESILRGTARYHASKTLTLESGIEGAYNFLNGRSSYLLNDAPIALPAANAHVHEARGEAFAQASWTISPEWSLEAGLHAELSGIAAQGVPARDFFFLKPRLLVSWSPWTGHQFRLRLERVAGQLDFSNFIASSDLAGSGISAGNLSLRPDRRWQLEGDYEWHFWNKGALVFSYMHEDITDLLDYVPIGGGLDGPGNVHKAVNDQFDLELSVPLEKLGLDGGLFRISSIWRDSALADPMTGQTRSISDARDRTQNLEYIQDIPAWNSTFDINVTPSGFSQPSYRISQVSKMRIRSTYVDVSWDYKPKPGLDVLFKISNAIPYRFELEQDNFSGPRDVSPLVQIQDQRLVTEPRFLFQVRKTF